jgi:hypothetical protein
MALNFTAGVTAFETMIDNFSKTISRTPITQTISNISGNETLTEGTSANITGAFFKQQDSYAQSNPGLIQNADAVLIVKTSVTINKNDKLTYNGESFRVDEVETRSLNGTPFYKVARCFLI